MDSKITNGFKTLLLAGVGAAALTVDKSQEILKDLVERGELTVEQGKALNQELKHKLQSAEETAEITYATTPEKSADDIIAGLTEEQILELKELLLAPEKKSE